MKPHIKNFFVLELAMIIVFSVSVLVILVSSIVGKSISPLEQLATFPVAIMVIGIVCATMPVSIIFRKLGCKQGFLLAVFWGILGTNIGSLAIQWQNFWLFCMANFMLGNTLAFAHQTRFVILRGFSDKSKNIVISLFLTGGIISGLLGPQVAKMFKDSFFNSEFAGSYFVMGILFVVSFFILLFYQNINIEQETPKNQNQNNENKNQTKSEIHLLFSPYFIVPVLCGLASYFLMSLIMTATPLEMKINGNFDFEWIVLVIQVHILGMFVPSLFTGLIINKIGNFKVMYIGMAFFIISAIFAVNGVEYINYLLALLFLGLGWNFMFISSTSMLVKYNSSENLIKIQGKNDFCVFFAQATASILSGLLILKLGWFNLNSIVFPVIFFTFLYVVYKQKVFENSEEIALSK